MQTDRVLVFTGHRMWISEIQKRIQNLIKHLRLSFLQKQATTECHSILVKSSILDVWQSSEYASEISSFSNENSSENSKVFFDVVLLSLL